MSELTSNPYAAIEPTVLQRLWQFRQRRRYLTLCRGLAATAIVLATTALFATVLDGWIDHPAARWAGSLTMYLATGFALYRWCYQPWQSPLDWKSEAARMERAVPGLSDKLLSAVELSDASDANGDPRGSDRSSGSSEFRAALQSEVATEMEPIDVRTALPWRRVQRMVHKGLGAVAFLCLLLIIPGLHFRERLTRIAMPGADLGRVGSVSIRINRPQPASQLVPRDDIVAVSATVLRGEPKQVWLETRSGAGDAKVEMNKSAPDVSVPRSERKTNFEATLTASAPEMEYRIIADDASTPWHRLDTKPRPTVIEFAKSIQAPSYAGPREPVDDNQQSGDVSALLGSTVELSLKLSQPCALAEIRWEADQLGAVPTQRLKLDFDPTRDTYVARFEVLETTAYRVFLKCADSGFTNPFSPSYRVTAIEDRPPIVDWIKPDTTSLAASATTILPLAGRATDELPLRELTQLVRVGNSEWQPLGDSNSAAFVPSTSDSTWDQSWGFDLLPFKLSAGDVLETKLLALDQAGHTSESAVLKLYISSASLALAASTHEESQQLLASELERLSVRASTIYEPLGEMFADKASVRIDEFSVVEISREFQEHLRSAIPAILGLVQSSGGEAFQDTVEAKAQRNTGDVLAQLLTLELRKLSDLESSSPFNANAIHETTAQIQTQLRELAQHARSFATFSLIVRHSGQLTRMQAAYAQLADEQNLPSPEQQLRQHEVLNRQLQELQQSMFDSVGDVAQQSQERLRLSAENLGRQIDSNERRLENSSSAQLREIATSTAEYLSAARLLSRIDGDIPEAIKRAQRWFHQRLTPSDRPLQGLARDASQRTLTSRDAAVSDSIALLSMRRDLARAPVGNDRVLAADLGTAERALTWICEQTDATLAERSRDLGVVAEAVSVLNAAAELNTADVHLRELLGNERWRLNAPESAALHPRAWGAFQLQDELAANRIREAKLPGEISGLADQLRWMPAAQRADRSISIRLWANEPPVSGAGPLDVLAQQMTQVQEQLKPHVLAARARLEELAPSLTELAAEAARETRKLSAQTQASSEQARDNAAIDDDANELREALQPAVDASTAPLETLRRALVEEADRQNLLDTDERLAAQRADAARDVVDRAMDLATESLANALESAEPSERPAQLEQAAQDQASAADALEQLAKLLDDAVKPSDASEQGETQLSQLRQLAEQTLAPEASNSSNDPQYADAQRLQRLADADPEEVLRQLEQQLKTNLPMQAEISDIAEAAARAALDELTRAASTQQTVAPRLEESDAEVLAIKRQLVTELQSAREQTSQTIGNLISESRSAAGAGEESDTEASIGELEERLRATAQQASPPSMEMTQAELYQATAELANLLATASDDLKQHAKSLVQAQEKQVYANGSDLKNRRREMTDRQRRIQQQDARSAQRTEQNAQQAQRRAETSWQQTQRQVEKEAKKLAQAEKNLEKRPDAPQFQQQIDEAQRRIAEAQQTAAAQQRELNALKERTEQARQMLQNINQNQPPSLAANNPGAELAAQLAAKAAERVGILANGLQQAAAANPVATRASAQKIEQSVTLENDVQTDVDSSAESLARAARHESRLGNATASQILGGQSQQVESLSQNEVSAASQSLNEAADSALQDATRQRATAISTAEAMGQAESAGEAIAQAAGLLRALLDGPQGSSNNGQASSAASQQTATSRSESTNPQLFSPQQLAQMLDELDRRLNSPADSQQSLGQTDNDSQAPANLGPANVGPANLGPANNGPTSPISQAAAELASEMSRGRETSPSPSPSDLASATDSQMANADPRAAVSVRVQPVDRNSAANWGELRERSAEGNLETQRETLAPQFQRQVDAYFKQLSSKAGKKN